MDEDPIPGQTPDSANNIPQDHTSAEQSKPTLASLAAESKEAETNIAFTIHFDKEQLAQERDQINPEGVATLEAILKFPDNLNFPQGTTLLIGPNGSGKSTMLGLIQLMGKATRLHEIHEENVKYSPDRYEPETWEQSRDGVLEMRGTPTSQVKKLGIAPTLAKHTTIVGSTENLGITKTYNVPEQAGAIWASLARGEFASFGGAGQYIPGRKMEDSEVVGSTQQIVDRLVFKEIAADLKDNPTRPKMLLLDEPTSNADLQRSMNFLHELDQLRTAASPSANFIVATNEGLLALHRNIPRLDMAHPERGVHYLRDFPLDQDVVAALKDLGYTPAETAKN